MIEAELKYVVHDVPGLRRRLAGFANPRLLTYHDAYFDHPLLNLDARDGELRVRVINERGRQPQVLLTYKGETVDPRTSSKTEFEIAVQSESEEIRRFLEAMGFGIIIAFEKSCEHYDFAFKGYEVSATIVMVPELQGRFVEVETLLADSSLIANGLAELERLAAELGLDAKLRTTAAYSDMVAAKRGGL